MNTDQRPTPETDAREQHLRLIAIDHGASREELVIQFGHTARRLERERDEAREQRDNLYRGLDALTHVVGLTPFTGNKSVLQEAFDQARKLISTFDLR